MQAASRGGSDDITNAMAMCKHHHWAYDEGFFALSNDGDILRRADMARNMVEELRGHTRAYFPVDFNLWPKAANLMAHRSQFGFPESD
nr:HNH endonuclease [Devosia oryzisoli]